MTARVIAAALAAALLAAPGLAAEGPPAGHQDQSAQSLPKWSGLWIGENLQPGITGFPPPEAQRFFGLAGRDAPWNESGRERFERNLRHQAHGKASGWGYPMMMGSSAPLQFIITAEETLIINPYRDVRHIYTDGRAFPADEDRWPTPWGESIGRWEGDTLVIETIGVKHPPDFFHFAPPLSSQARYFERIRMTAPDRIEAQFTILDPATLTRPWQVTIVYRPAIGMDRLIHESFENDRTGSDGELNTIEPPRGPP